MGKISDLYNKFEAERNAALMDAAIEKEIENLDYEISLFQSAINGLCPQNIDNIILVDNKKFLIVFDDFLDLLDIVNLDMPEGIEIYGDDYGVQITINDNCPERLDEHFEAIVKSVESAINDRKRQIEELVGKKTS